MKPILIFAFNLLIILTCFSQAGSLDKSFGNGGKVYTYVERLCYTSALQPDGKLLAGTASYFLIRYLPDGSLDSSFARTGIASAPGLTHLKGIHVEEDGSILTGGTSDEYVAVAKFKQDGSLDSSYGTNGIVIGDRGYVNAMQVQADGKIVLAGKIFLDEYTPRKLLVRLNADGSYDNSFGNKGEIITNDSYEYSCLALQQDGKIIACGHFWPGGAGFQDFFTIRRYNTDGSLDSSFGYKGTINTQVSDGNDVPYDIKISNDGEILVTGIAHDNLSTFDSYMTLIKYTTNGRLDSSFADKGIANIIFENKESEAKSLLLQPDGKYILGGNAYTSNIEHHADFALARLNSNGVLDSSFGTNGKQVSDFGNEEVAATAVLQHDGKILLFGNSYIQNTPILVARYNNDEVMPLHFTYFNASPTNNVGIALNWQTAQENNNDYFSIQRSINTTSNFNELTRINSKGNSSQAHIYSYTDNTPLQGTNFYRLKQVDKDGKFSYSQIVSATVQNGLTVILYPNPVKDVLNIKGLDAGMSYELSVMSAKGNLVAKTQINNTSSYSWNLQSLSKGVYYLSLISNNKKTAVKFVRE